MSGLMKPPFGARLKLDHPLARGLVGAWLFNEGAGDKAYDYSGQGKHGTLTGMSNPPTATSGWNAGPHGGALAFQSVSGGMVVCPNLLYGESECTIIALAKRASTAQRITLGVLNVNDERAELVWYDNGKLYAEVGASQNDWVSASVTNNTGWHFLAFTFSGSGGSNYDKIKLYFDGKPIAPTSQSGTIGSSITCSAPLYIGWRGNGHSDGCVSSAYIYNRALSAEEIAYLYAQPYCMFEEQSYQGTWRPTVFNESLLLSLSAGVTRESVLSAVEAVAFAVNAIESRSARTEMDVGLSLGIAAEQGTDKNLTASVLAELAAAAGMSQESVHSLQEAVTLATAVGAGQSNQAIIANALILHATASMIQASVGSLSASLNLDTSVGAAFGTALILQASVLLGAAGGLSASGGMSADEEAVLGMNAGMAQVTRLLLSEAVALNAQASQAQAATMTAEEQAALAIACDQIDSMELNFDVSLALTIVAGMQHWGIAPRIAAARHLYNALARKREYDAKG